MKVSQNTRVVITVVAILLGLLFTVYILNRPIHASIYTYLPYIYGSASLLAGLYLFLLVFRIYKPKHKTEERLKVADLIERRGKLWKFNSVFLILFGAYTLIRHDPNMFRLNSAVENSKWTDKDKAELIKMCMNSVPNTSKKYYQITLDYCTCSIEKMMKSIGREEYIEDSSKSADELHKIDSPFIQGCLIIFNRQVDSVKSERNKIQPTL